MSEFDLFSEETLKQHVMQSEGLAEQYKKACEDLADAKLELDRQYVKALKEGAIKESTSYEKALIVISSLSPESEGTYQIYVKSGQLVKGLEKVLETRSQTVVLNMALMKNRQSQKI